MFLADGFPGQRMHVLPRPLVHEALVRVPTSHLLVTDAGYFPHAAQHGRDRDQGTAETIVILCESGAGVCELGQASHPVAAGQVLIIPAGTPHRYQADPADPWSIWWLHLAGDDVPDLLAAIELSISNPTALVADPVQAASLIESVCVQLGRDETASSLVGASGAAWHLLAQLASERHRRSPADAWVGRVQTRLRRNLAARVEPAALAAEVGFSVSHFSARFSAVTGYSVTEYLKRLRMARARELLVTTDRTIASIAAEVGYDDQFYFSRQFRAVSGVSPRAFRSRMAGDPIGG